MANGNHRSRRPRLLRALALAVIAQVTWLFKRRGSLRREVAEHGQDRGPREHHLQGLPVYADVAA